MYLHTTPTTHHLTATSDAKSNLKAATEESEQAEATIEANKLQAKKDADDLAELRKSVTELEAQNKLETMKYQGKPTFLLSETF